MKIIVVFSLLCFLHLENLYAQEWEAVGGVKTHRYILDNGLEVFISENQDAPVVEVHHWVKAGSLQERPGITGIAHLFEHMMFRPVRGEEQNFFDKIKPLGGSANANTRYMATYYTSSVPAENLDRLLFYEADRFRNLKVSDDLLDVERKAVWSEYSTKFDTSPVIDLWGKIYELAFKGHPYEWTIIGYRQDLNKITAKDANSFFQRFYVPNNIGLFISGDVRAENVIQLVKKYYGTWPKGQESVMPAPYKADSKMLIGKGRIASPSNQILAGFRLLDENKYALEYYVLNHILFGSGNSLANRRLYVDKKYVSSISDFNYDYDSGMMKFFMVSLSPKWQRLIPQIMALKEDFKNLSDEDFEAFKREFLIGYKEGALRNARFNEALALAWGKYDDVQFFFDFEDRIQKVSKLDLWNVMQLFYNKTNLVLVRAKR